MSKLLQVDRAKRITVHEFIGHAWIKNEGSTPDDDPRRKENNNDSNLNIFCEIKKQFSTFVNSYNVKKAICVFFRNQLEWMKPRDLVRLKSVFVELDKNCDKKISFEQFKVGLIKMKHLQWSQKLIEKYFDDNNCNFNPSAIEISFYDLIDAVVHDYQVCCDVLSYRSCKNMDKDDCDVIETQELKKTLKTDGWTRDRYAEILKMIDESGLDKDGKINVCGIYEQNCLFIDHRSCVIVLCI